MKLSFEDLKNKTCVITGGAGVIGTAITKGLASVGVQCAIVDINAETAKKVATEIEAETGTKCIGVEASVLDKNSLIKAKAIINKEFGDIHFLINGAGGNSPKATTKIEKLDKDNLNELENSFYGLEMEGFQWVFDLNFKGTLLPTMVFTTDMLHMGKGSVINISSMNSFKPLTKIPAYSAAKASVNNFTEWLAVHLAKTGIRVNAIAPGFFLTNQNRFLLVDEKSGKPTPRGEKIISSTPMGKYGNPEDIQGTVTYLLSDISAFITGIIVPVDGGYSAYGGV
ncbi:MAG: SDR family oxidoreductase [Bacteroidales bacterium]|nr:SDR family oxidoreductase [Bacteroidales bacterium]